MIDEIKKDNFYFKITVVVPAIILEDKTTSEMESNLSLDALQIEEKSRRFSQLPPASVDSPNAVKVGKFGVVPTPEVKSPVSLSPLGRLLVASAQEEKSRRFSKLPPASVDSPNAVKLGSKFTMISREEQDEQK